MALVQKLNIATTELPNVMKRETELCIIAQTHFKFISQKGQRNSTDFILPSKKFRISDEHKGGLEVSVKINSLQTI